MNSKDACVGLHAYVIVYMGVCFSARACAFVRLCVCGGGGGCECVGVND